MLARGARAILWGGAVRRRWVKREFVLPTPVAFFAIKRVQVLAKMSKTGDTDYTCVPFVAIFDTGVRLYCVSPINSDLSVKYFYFPMQ